MPAKTKARGHAAGQLYSVHPSISHVRAIIDNLPEKTGKSLEQWIKIVKKSGPKGEKERREWLKKEHNLGNTTASMIAEFADGKGMDEFDADVYLKNAARYVEDMYTGPKAGLRPLHDTLIDLGLSLGSDVRICPCQTIVPLYRNHVFAQIKPTTRTRIDFGLALKNAKEKLSPRLIDTGGLAKKDRITHRFAISSLADIDDEVRKWARIAYDLDG